MRRLASLACSIVLLAACSDGGSDASTESAASPTTVASTDVVDSVPEATTPTAVATTTTEPPAQYAATIDELLELDRPIVIAHTAGEDEFPASTLFAFGESVKAGADMLDLNVLLTKDGVLLIQHDDTVDRTTNGTGAVADLTYEEIAVLDAGYWFTAGCGACTDQPEADYLYRSIRTGERPPPGGYMADDFATPTFRQLVERFPDIPLNIEIKGTGPAAEAAADQLVLELNELGRADASVVASFDDAIVSYVHSIAPDIEVAPGLGVLTAYVLENTPIPDGMRILQLPPEFSGLVVITTELIERSKADGYPIWVWPNDRRLENYDAYLAFLQQGIAGLNINFPAQGVQAVNDFITPGGLLTPAPTPACKADSEGLEPDATLPFVAAGLAGTITGMSNGAMMTSSVVCALSDRVAAAAAVAGVRNPKGCEFSRPVPIVAFHGTKDQYLAFDGGYGPKVAGLPNPSGEGSLGDGSVVAAPAAESVPEMTGAWATRNGCNAAEPTESAVTADVTLLTWDCARGADALLYRVDGGGHAWPGSAFSASIVDFVGYTTMTISASDIMWQFFRSHPLTV